MQFHRIQALFRFNNLLYDENYIHKAGIQVYGMEFPDGRFPKPHEIDTFLTEAFK